MIAITGSTGTIGRELIRRLSAAGADVVAIHRSAHKADPLPHVTWAQADLADTGRVERALQSSDRLFLLTGNEPDFQRVQIGVLRAAERAGVEHVVKLSALGASSHSNSAIAREHWAVEQVLAETAMEWTMLRPHAFMQNWLGDVADSVRDEGVIYAPIGDGRVPFIDTRDIAAVAAKVLLDPPEHVASKYFLTGGEAVGYTDVAAALTTLSGRAVTYHPISMDEARERLAGQGVTPKQIEAMLAIAAYQQAGGPTSIVSPNVERLLARPPRTILEFLRDHVAHFAPTHDVAGRSPNQ